MRILSVFKIFSLVLLTCYQGVAQTQPSASEIKLKLKKLNFLGSVLYVAAHPDDENTRAIAYLANDQLAATAYLSMTRGDGGQNLIGSEMGELLGLIRTQELMAARRMDGGEQFFTRAIDFGFSKNYQETLQIWNKDEVLSDVVHVIRKFQPDVILTRFPPDERAGHGHHTSSAILAQEAFDAAADALRYPKQVKELGVWQTSAIYTNTGRWWNQTINENTPGVLMINVGTYSNLLGKSYAEIAAESRTQHKSQGFGSPGRRGDAPEFFEFVKGTKADKALFEKVNTTWTRLDGGAAIEPLVLKAIKEYDEENPAASIQALLEIRKAISKLSESVWKTRKLNEVESLIKDCTGLFLDVTSNQPLIAPGEPVRLSFELINRSAVPVSITNLTCSNLGYDSAFTLPLKYNQPVLFQSTQTIMRQEYSAPYWLAQPHARGLFTVNDPGLIGKPENDAAIELIARVNIAGEVLVIKMPVTYKWTDPVKGELSRPFEIVPPVFATFTQSVYLIRNKVSQPVRVTLKSGSHKKITGTLKLDIPSDWVCNPHSITFNLEHANEEQVFTFQVTGGKEETDAQIKAIAEVNGKPYSLSYKQIQYDHIPTQTLLPPAQARALRIDANKEGTVVGYLKGAGDEIPVALQNLGYEVLEMKNEEVTVLNLKRLDAVVLGIRALNTNERIGFLMPVLHEYVKSGGTLIVQYNTSNDLEIDASKIAPYPLTLSRDRVTEEDSEVRIIKPDHPALNTPNKITAKDFEGWIQERGLYFPSAWDASFDALLSMNDKGEPARNGSLLVAQYGAGYYVYTGLSFFRELPEGVPGAYKLFANLVSLGKSKAQSSTKVKSKVK
ncbi:MAG TPA: PIG-L family deacetylase [Cyclobacteriaceae bacterium]|nr:PIG-L family deacetylase [Cytophagales bacterium]HRE67201.1 PIG-L family deacetylase [Cyclobacteriaceae bacterium]HRF35281.1 PIG-L family deacetylase [Cyclobacteriaceae bacterium]